MFKRKLLGLSLAVAAVSSWPVSASVVVPIDPDAGGVDPVINVGALGWGNGNALIVPVTGNVTNPQVGDLTQVYGANRLEAFLDQFGNPIGGLNLNGINPATNYEWTYTIAFQEEVAAVTGLPPTGTTVLQSVAGGDNYFNIYYDPTPDSINLNGTGFGPDFTSADEVLILQGTVLPFDQLSGIGDTTFTATGFSGTSLDQFITDNYDGTGGSNDINTITGLGTGDLLIDVTFQDPNFFQTNVAVLELDFDSFINLPFQQTDPSSCMWANGALTDAAGPNTGLGATAPCSTNTLGLVNGLPESDGTGGLLDKNTLLQTRSTNNFEEEQVPEPATLALLGAGLGILAFGQRRRNKKTS